jgi:hypothetical protein
VLDSEGDFVASWPEASTGLQEPAAVALNAAGEVFIADDDSGLVRKYDAIGSLVEDWSFTVPADPSLGINIEDMVVGADGKVYILTLSDVLIVSPEGSLLDQFPVNGFGPADLGPPSSFGLDDLGRIYVNHLGFQKSSRPEVTLSQGISRFSSEGEFDVHWNLGVPAERLGVQGAAMALHGERIYTNHQGLLAVFDLNGRQLDSWFSGQPSALATDAAGNLYIARDFAAFGESNLPVHAKYSPDGILLAEWIPPEDTACGTPSLRDIAVGPTGPVYVVTGLEGCVNVYEPAS